MRDLFDDSLTGLSKYEEILERRYDLMRQVTFTENKKTPVYNWLYYKEGYSPNLVWKVLEAYDIKGTVVDPFCGTGTTLLACKQKGLDAIGYDILPLGVFTSNVKLEGAYDREKISMESRRLFEHKFGPAKTRMTDLRFIDMRKAFNKYARNDVMFFKECIQEVEDDKIRNLMMLALVSIVGQASNVKKDGGVLRIVRKKHVPPVRHLLKNKLKRMGRDIKKFDWGTGKAQALQGDARSLPLEDESVDAVITSPPYLNFVDYTKLYGLELAMLVDNPRDMENLRKSSLRSHVNARYDQELEPKNKMLTQVVDFVKKSATGSPGTPEMVEGYFSDMITCMEQMHRILKPGGICALVVGNACLPGITVDVDILLAELGEQIGFTVDKLWVAHTRWCDVHGISRERPVRETVVILRKQ